MAYKLIYNPALENQPQGEGLVGGAVRNVVRGGARVAEAVAGFPADIAQGALGLANLGYEKLTGSESPLPKRIPLTSEWLKENVTTPLAETVLPKDYLKPHGKIEETADEFLGDLASLAVPIGGAGKLGMKAVLKRAGIVAGAGNAASLLAKGFGASEGTRTGLKIGTMLATSAFSPARINQKIDELYKVADTTVPQKGLLSAEELIPELDTLGKDLKIGEMTASKEFLRDRIKSIKEKIVNEKYTTGSPIAKTLKEGISKKDFLEPISEFGIKNIKNASIPVNELWELKKNINEHLGDLYKKGANEKTIGYAEQLNGILNKTLKGKEAFEKYPAFAESLTKADSLVSASLHSTALGKLVNKYLDPSKMKSAYTIGAFFNPKMVAGAIAAKVIYPPIERLLTNKVMFKHYMGAMTAAMNDQKAALLKNIKAFDKEAARVYPTSKQQPSGYRLVSGSMKKRA